MRKFIGWLKEPSSVASGAYVMVGLGLVWVYRISEIRWHWSTTLVVTMVIMFVLGRILRALGFGPSQER